MRLNPRRPTGGVCSGSGPPALPSAPAGDVPPPTSPSVTLRMMGIPFIQPQHLRSPRQPHGNKPDQTRPDSHSCAPCYRAPHYGRLTDYLTEPALGSVRQTHPPPLPRARKTPDPRARRPRNTPSGWWAGLNIGEQSRCAISHVVWLEIEGPRPQGFRSRRRRRGRSVRLHIVIEGGRAAHPPTVNNRIFCMHACDFASALG
ncbi:hypothetical protein QBC39DRAFT_66677 [Podospora conica]|nr:hypothetical protein QBC39DRAFT_66677 [Schizothecium conicum]